MKFALFTAACASALLAAAAHAGPVSSYPAATTPYTGGETFFCVQAGASAKCDAADAAKTVVTSLVSGAPTSGHCAEWNSPTVLQDAGAACGTVSVPGANGQLLYNVGGVFGATSALSYVSGTLESFNYTTPALAFATGGGTYLQLNPSTSASTACFAFNYPPTTAGTCLVQLSGNGEADVFGNFRLYAAGGGAALLSLVTTGSAPYGTFANNFNLGFGTAGLCYGGATYTLEVDEGTCGGPLGILKTGIVAAVTVSPMTTLNLPDGGQDNPTTGLQVGTHTTGSVGEIAIQNGIGATMVPPAITTYGAGLLGPQQTSVSLGLTGEYMVPGMIIQGWPTPAPPSCSTHFCQQNDVSIVNSNGQIVAGAWSSPDPAKVWPFTIGEAKTYSPAQTDEGYGPVQLFLADVVPSGTIEGPLIIWQPGGSQATPATAQAFIGMGRESPVNPNVFFGPAVNNNTVWDDTAADQPDLDVLGCFGTGIGSASAVEEGEPVNYMTTKFCAISGGGIEIMNAAKTAAKPIEASFYRTTPMTVSGLSALDASPSVGDRAFVTDAIACTFSSSLTGGGAIKCPAVYNGSAWVAG